MKAKQPSGTGGQHKALYLGVHPSTLIASDPSSLGYPTEQLSREDLCQDGLAVPTAAGCPRRGGPAIAQKPVSLLIFMR